MFTKLNNFNKHGNIFVLHIVISLISTSYTNGHYEGGKGEELVLKNRWGWGYLHRLFFYLDLDSYYLRGLEV